MRIVAHTVSAPALTAPTSSTPAAHTGSIGLGPIEHSSDFKTFEAMKAGTMPIDEGMNRIAHGGGWPIAVPGGFLVATPNPDGKPISVASDHNGWSPQPMTQAGGLAFTIVHGGSQDAAYALVRDGQHTPDPWARRYRHTDTGEVSMTRASGNHLERWPLMGAPTLRPRTVRVWVPKGKVTHHLYAHDGQNLFDPKAMHGGWRMQDHLGDNTMVIAIDNTGARFDEYTPVADDIGDGVQRGGKGNLHADWVAGPLKKFVEERYGAPKRVGIIGSSLGGLASLNTALRHPETYDFVGSMSGTLGWGKIGSDNPTIIDKYASSTPSNPVYYLDSGGHPGKDNYSETQQMKETLESQGHLHGESLFHWYEPKAPHSEGAWAARVHRPIEIFESI